MRYALILVNDFTRQCFVKLLKTKTQFEVAQALDEHFQQQRPVSTGVKGVNFYIHHTTLRSDRGSEFINSAVQDVCSKHGCFPEYSCPGQLGKYQNGVVERRIKEIGRMARAMMYTSDAPDLASVYGLLQAVDILNVLPTTANDAASTNGFSPHSLYYGSAPSLDECYPFGSFCTVHLDDDHIDPSRPLVRAAQCIYLCRAHHLQSKGHVLWEYRASGKGRKLIVPTIGHNIWNYFPLRNHDSQHLTSLLTFVPAAVPSAHESPTASDVSLSTQIEPPLSACDVMNPLSPDFPNSQVILDADERSILQHEHIAVPRSSYRTRQYDRMHKNIGTPVRRVFFINGSSGPTDYFEGAVRSITSNYKYDVAYDDNDCEEMTEQEFAKYRLPPTVQAKAHLAQLGGKDRWYVSCSDCNCATDHCYHPWAKTTPNFVPQDMKKKLTVNAGIRKQDITDDRVMFPSMEPPQVPEFILLLTLHI